MVVGRLAGMVQQPAVTAEVAETCHVSAEVRPCAIVAAVANRFLQIRVDLHLRTNDARWLESSTVDSVLI